MDELYMMGDDPSVYLSPPESLTAPLISTEKILMEQSGLGDDDVIITNSTNQMLDVVNNNSNSNKRQRKGNRRQNNNQQQRNRNRNSNNQNDGTSFDDNNPINVISAFNRTGKIYNKLRKNDAVKVIDTPSGRAGFVYQSGTSSNSASSSSSINSNANNQDSPISTSIKESNTNNWDDPYSNNHFVNRNANDVKLIPSDDTSNKKILPVLTSDGKIALVVRGDTSRYFDESQNNGSGNSINSKKYEPITNLTSIITALNSNNDNNNFNKHNDSINVSDTNVELKSIQEQNRLINRLDEFFASVTNKVKHIEEELEQKLGIDLDDDSNDGRDKIEDSDDESFQVDPMTTTTTTMEALVDEDDKVGKDLLLINRPLSEVLGLPKKTHYHHPHDPMHTTPTEIPYIRQSNENRRTNTAHKTSSTQSSTTTITTTTTTTTEEFDLESPEKINIAVIPRFDSELEERLFGKSRDNMNRNMNERTNEIPNTSGAISSIHCAMQVMIAIACACTIFGVLGAYYRNNIVNQIRILHW
ncbi:putative uncharacterized protein DDB_G0282499 [Chironomus tepperi]|uniref:putative uncharacterized protein DDB_G0282499 n=1 Tax=Chironomus tepperi TaxID=113505 RepID=UPI00391F9304